MASDHSYRGGGNAGHEFDGGLCVRFGSVGSRCRDGLTAASVNQGTDWSAAFSVWQRYLTGRLALYGPEP